MHYGMMAFTLYHFRSIRHIVFLWLNSAANPTVWHTRVRAEVEAIINRLSREYWCSPVRDTLDDCHRELRPTKSGRRELIPQCTDQQSFRCRRWSRLWKAYYYKATTAAFEVLFFFWGGGVCATDTIDWNFIRIKRS